MIEDDVIWEIINNAHCSFKAKTATQTFCRNEFNLTGLCSHQSCPLAQSRYSTIIESKGLCVLHIKTPERAHMPSQLWAKIPLDASYAKALQQIETELEFFPKFQIHKCKQRLTKIRQMLIRMRKLKMQVKEELIPIKNKTRRRERARELKAEKAAQLELSIEKELINRLKEGVYGEIYNFPQKAYQKIVGSEEVPEEEEEEDYEYEEEYEDEDQIELEQEEADLMETILRKGGGEEQNSSDEEEESKEFDIEDLDKVGMSGEEARAWREKAKKAKQKLGKRKDEPAIEIEFEQEFDQNPPEAQVQLNQ